MLSVFIASFVVFFTIQNVNAAHDMDIAGENLATDALGGKFVVSDKLSILLAEEKNTKPWQEMWNDPGKLTEQEIAELKSKIAHKVDANKFKEFMAALSSSGLSTTDQQTILLLLPSLLDIVL